MVDLRAQVAEARQPIKRGAKSGTTATTKGRLGDLAAFKQCLLEERTEWRGGGQARHGGVAFSAEERRGGSLCTVVVLTSD